jgi:hypothetical protein
MPTEINRPPPLKDWEKALLLCAIASGDVPCRTQDEFAKKLSRLTDWPLKRSEEAIAEAHLSGMLEPFNPDAH